MAVLVVTEKPSVAQSIARVIGAGERKDGYMEGNGSRFVVHRAFGGACAAGCLF